MADLNPLYTTGTVSIGAGGTTLTGVGTNWLSADLRVGDLVFIGGLSTRLTGAPTTNTSLPVAAWPGAAVGAGAPYYIVRLSDAVRLISANASLMQALVPNLVAEGGLTGAADKVSYFTGAGTKNLADFKALARSIGNLTGINGGFIRSTGAGTAIMQAIVGTVSQTGGVPTGAIVEKGSNANGKYIRLADGTQICWIANHSLEYLTDKIYQKIWTFPAAFIDEPTKLAGMRDWNPWPNAGPSYLVCRAGGGNYSHIQYWGSGLPSTFTLATVVVLAIGKWF